MIPGQGFDATTKQLITQAVQSPGAIYPSTGEVTFQRDSIFPVDIFKEASGSRDIKFECFDSNLCGSPTTQLEVKDNFRAKVYVCCDRDIGGCCKIGIGTSSGVSCSATGSSPGTCY